VALEAGRLTINLRFGSIFALIGKRAFPLVALCLLAIHHLTLVVVALSASGL
jgi:hypothetical protein